MACDPFARVRWLRGNPEKLTPWQLEEIEAMRGRVKQYAQESEAMQAWRRMYRAEQARRLQPAPVDVGWNSLAEELFRAKVEVVG